MRNQPLALALSTALSACGGVVLLDTSDAAVTGDGAGANGATSSGSGSTTEPGGGPGSATASMPYPPPPSASSGGALAITPSGTVYRFHPDGTTPYPFRAANDAPSWIDQQDCDDDVILQFTLEEGGLPTADTIQVWAGVTDCTQDSARKEATGAAQCWQVAPLGEFGDSQTVTGNLYVRNIVRDLFLQYVDVAPVTGVAGPSACSMLGSVGECPSALNLYFMFINPDGITVDSWLSYGQGIFLGMSASGECLHAG
jgi:hypothetical protein